MRWASGIQMPLSLASPHSAAATAPFPRGLGDLRQQGVCSDEKPKAGPGVGGQRRPQGLAHLGEWTQKVAEGLAWGLNVGARENFRFPTFGGLAGGQRRGGTHQALPAPASLRPELQLWRPRLRPSDQAMVAPELSVHTGQQDSLAVYLLALQGSCIGRQ